MPEPPPGYSIFDDDGDPVTAVDQSFWKTPEIPRYPALARFGRFEILGRIARGGMAEVYLAREVAEDGTTRHVVVKRILPEMQDNEQLLAMFLEEGQTATTLYHPNVCHVYECGETEGVTFMALEWVFGPSLQQVIERAAELAKRPDVQQKAVLPWPIGVHVIAEVAQALQYVHHAKGVTGKPLDIVHRDVSPHNVMVSWEGATKLLDFGIAKTGTQDDSATRGKYAYMSPEQARSKPVDFRSDLFALGICLYEVVTARPLYERGTVHETLRAIVHEPPPAATAVRPDLPPAIDRILMRALAKEPQQRFASAGEMGAALQQVLRSQGQAVTGQRVALQLAALFEPKERTPLPPNASQITGSFQALSFTAPPANEITYERFVQPAEPEPEEGIDVDVQVDLDDGKKKIEAKSEKEGGSSAALWIAILLGLAIGVGGGLAAWFFVWR